MSQHADILDERESLRGSFFGSLVVHAGVIALPFLFTFMRGNSVEHWGDPNSLGGGAVGITPVERIPIPSRQGRINPVANDTESQIPSAPEKPQPKQQPVQPDRDAVALKSRNPQKKPAPQATQKYSPIKEPRPNQVYSSTGQAATSPMFSQSGSGQVGSGSASPFGNRFGYYEQLIRDKVARNWRSQDLDASVHNPVIVTFDILRTGNIQNVRVTRSSGNFAADQSAQRAILMSNPFPPLPAQYEHDLATIEFSFRLQ
jgi:periplasmic protein TonB